MDFSGSQSPWRTNGLYRRPIAGGRTRYLSRRPIPGRNHGLSRQPIAPAAIEEDDNQIRNQSRTQFAERDMKTPTTCRGSTGERLALDAVRSRHAVARQGRA
jgi:hypothetical protein